MGSGGSGAKVYPFFEGHSGAYVASRVLAEVSRRWFSALPDDLRACFGSKEGKKAETLDRSIFKGMF